MNLRPDKLRIGYPPIEVALRRHAQARRLTLRISHGEERIVLTVPKRVSLTEARNFAQSKEDWIRERLQCQPEPVRLKAGDQLPVLGESLTLAAGSGRTSLKGNTLYVSGDAETFRKRLLVYLKYRAREALVEACDHYSDQIGRTYKKFTLRDTRSRWGSCSSSGGLMFSWRLVLAPFEVMDYVAAHEVAHLAHMNHGPKFWECVKELMPDYLSHRDWLQHNGATLHSYRFD